MATLFLGGEGGLEDLRDDVFNPPDPPAQAGPPVCTHHPSFITFSAAGLYLVRVRSREVVLWRGPYQLELPNHARTDVDVVMQRAMSGILPFARLASVWQFINNRPPFTHSNDGKRGGGTIRSSCECEVRKEYACFRARFSRHCAISAHCVVCLLGASCLQTSRDFRTVLDIIFFGSYVIFVIAYFV